MADVPVRPGLTIPDSALSWRFSRSSGPGGQSVNTSDSRAELRFDVSALPEPFRGRALRRLAKQLVEGTVVSVVAAEQRSQLRNRQAAEARLAQLLRSATAAPARPRRPTRPSRNSVERRLAGKRRRGEIKRHRGGSPGDDS